MQVTMTYSSEMSLSMPPILKGTAPGVAKQQYRRQQRQHPKSQPFDPEDLRRRLYVVIAEREAQNEKRQRQRVDAMPAKWAQVERERDMQHLYIESLASKNTTWPAPDMTAPTRRLAPQPKLRSQTSRHNKLRCRTSFFGPSESTDADVDTDTSPSTYRHIPEQAAAQFSRTTTSAGMQSDKSLVHSLSKAALRFYVEGASSADRQAIESSITPGKQRSILQRTRAQHERQHVRNQFQDQIESVPWRRPSKSGSSGGEGTIVEEECISALADLHLHTYREQSSVDDRRFSNDDMLVDASTANEHRVDWSQSDELLPHEKKGAKLPPLLRKTSSILTLKNRLGQHLRRNSADKGNNKIRIVTIQEDCDEQAEADADDGSTPMSPNSGSSRSGRPGIWGRLRRR
ncbi:hypothetical protein FHL15_006804 [Xylaria flabelliformis]|uniref:Uncharacterized protein n=1 Tax=Xylaria flabelliformis TaxID=2512241 RepID=A0A553HW51_9PEZI|nr:hypothetical protein FHL15_006804 [Xylaria flabelliformis]